MRLQRSSRAGQSAVAVPRGRRPGGAWRGSPLSASVAPPTPSPRAAAAAPRRRRHRRHRAPRPPSSPPPPPLSQPLPSVLPSPPLLAPFASQSPAPPPPPPPALLTAATAPRCAGDWQEEVASASLPPLRGCVRRAPPSSSSTLHVGVRRPYPSGRGEGGTALMRVEGGGGRRGGCGCRGCRCDGVVVVVCGCRCGVGGGRPHRLLRLPRLGDLAGVDASGRSSSAVAGRAEEDAEEDVRSRSKDSECQRLARRIELEGRSGRGRGPGVDAPLDGARSTDCTRWNDGRSYVSALPIRRRCCCAVAH